MIEIGFVPMTTEEINSFTNFADNITAEDIYNYIYYQNMYYNIAFESPQMFIFEYKKLWYRYYNYYSDIYKQYNSVISGDISKEHTVDDYEDIINKSTTITKDSTTTTTYTKGTQNTLDYSDTPNQELYEHGDVSMPRYLTNRTVSTDSGENSDTTTTRGNDSHVDTGTVINRGNKSKSYTDYEKFFALMYSDDGNPLIKFLNKFDVLFADYYAIQDIIY